MVQPFVQRWQSRFVEHAHGRRCRRGREIASVASEPACLQLCADRSACGFYSFTRAPVAAWGTFVNTFEGLKASDANGTCRLSASCRSSTACERRLISSRSHKCGASAASACAAARAAAVRSVPPWTSAL